MYCLFPYLLGGEPMFNILKSRQGIAFTMVVSLLAVIVFITVLFSHKPEQLQKTTIEEVRARHYNNFFKQAWGLLGDALVIATRKALENITVSMQTHGYYDRYTSGFDPETDFFDAISDCVGYQSKAVFYPNGTTILENNESIVCNQAILPLILNKAFNISSQSLGVVISYNVSNYSITQPSTWRLRINATFHLLVRGKGVEFSKSGTIARDIPIEGLYDPLLAPHKVLRRIKKHPSSMNFNNLSTINISDLYEFYNKTYYRAYLGIRFLDRFITERSPTSQGIETFLKPGEGLIKAFDDKSYLDRLYLSNATFNCSTELYRINYADFSEHFWLDATTLARYINISKYQAFLEHCSSGSGGNGLVPGPGHGNGHEHGGNNNGTEEISRNNGNNNGGGRNIGESETSGGLVGP